jgi:DHA1 family tetracycline resistance protein-like MFS transporter
MNAPASSGSTPRDARRAGLPFVLVTIWIDVLSWGGTIPVYPKLIIAFSGSTVEAAAVQGVFMTTFALIQLFASPMLGALSDAVGCRPVILAACAGLAVDLAIMAVAPNLWWLLVTRIIHAITAATHSTAGAYIADVTAPEERAKAYGYMGAAFSFGFIVGPGLGGMLGQIDLRLPFVAGALLAFANVIYGTFVLPESLPPHLRRPFRWRQANPFGALAFLRADKTVFALSGANFFMQVAHMIYPAMWVLYISHRYQWDAMMVGVTLAISGALSMLVQTFLVAPVVKRVGERLALIIGLVFWALAFAVEGWAPTTLIFLLGVPLGALSSFAGPALSSLVTQRVAPDQQGQLQGANGAIISLSGLVGPLLFTGVFAFAIAEERTVHVPGAPFYIAAALILAAAGVAAAASRAPAARAAAP